MLRRRRATRLGLCGIGWPDREESRRFSGLVAWPGRLSELRRLDVREEGTGRVRPVRQQMWTITAD